MFQQALIQSSTQLRKLKEDEAIGDFAIIGAFALARVAIPRATGDIDYIIKPGSQTLDNIAKQLGGKARRGDLSEPLVGVVSHALSDKSAPIPIQLIQFPKAIEDISMQDIVLQTVSDVAIPFVSWKSLLILKLYAGSALDLEDAFHILRAVNCSPKQYEEIETLSQRLRLLGRFKKVRRKLDKDSH